MDSNNLLGIEPNFIQTIYEHEENQDGLSGNGENIGEIYSDQIDGDADFGQDIYHGCDDGDTDI